jgi:hypothetical protein
MKYRINILLLIVLFLPSCGRNSSKTNYSYTVTHDSHSHWTIPIIAYNESKIFQANSTLAVEILAVSCNGQKVVPDFFHTAHPARAAIYNTDTIDSNMFIYYINFDLLESLARNNKPTNETYMKRYNIPQDAERVYIEYIIHFPDGKTSELCTVTSVNLEYIKLIRDDQI